MKVLTDRSVWAVAIAVAVLHLVPYWHALAVTEPGWTFTGNLHNSPDFMQYRSWPRQAAVEGPIVTNEFTSEPNRAHLPVFFYYAIGIVSDVTSVSPEWVFVYVGALFAMALTFLLVKVVRTFVEDRAHAWWIVGTILLGGGLGAHAKLAKAVVLQFAGSEAVADVEARITDTDFITWVWFEDYRGHYVFSALFDTHFLMIWTVATAAVLAYWAALSDFRPMRVAIAALAFAVATLLHIYEGVTLAAIVAGVSLLWWLKTRSTRPVVVTGVVLTAVAAICTVALLLLQVRSGLPVPGWRGLSIYASVLAFAYPVAWGLIAWGGVRYWIEGREREAFLLGWTFGCLVVTLSGPFYPYPDRGTMTLQIPIYVIAGTIFFRIWRRMTLPAGAIAVALMAVTPVWLFAGVWSMGQFNPDEPHKWVSDDHLRVIEALEQRAGGSDILVTDEQHVRWLAPRYPGRLYCGHFFLTVDYEAKCVAVEEFLEDDGAGQLEFLRQVGARYVFTSRTGSAESLSQLPDLAILEQTSYGTLFELRDGPP